MADNEITYFDTLRRIARNYQTPDQLRKRAERDWGCSYEEALEMAYENLQSEAAQAIKGKRRPKSKEQSKATPAAQGGK